MSATLHRYDGDIKQTLSSITPVKIPMNRKLHARLALALCLTALSSIPSPAVDLVFDPSVFGEAVTSAGEAVAQTAKQAEQYLVQLEQYATQLKQYEDMVKNTIAPAAYVWDQANQTITDLMGTVSVINGYKSKYGNLENYLSKFQDVGYYRNSPCYGPNGCSEADRAALQASRDLGSTSQKQATDALLKGIDKQQTQIDADSRNLERLQAQAQGAEGRMEALQAANQLASNQAAQLLQIRALLQAIKDSGKPKEGQDKQNAGTLYGPKSAGDNPASAAEAEA